MGAPTGVSTTSGGGTPSAGTSASDVDVAGGTSAPAGDTNPAGTGGQGGGRGGGQGVVAVPGTGGAAAVAGAATTAAAGVTAEGGAGFGGVTSSGAGVGATGVAQWREAMPVFERHDIADFQRGYYAVAFDVNRDGLLDVAALAAGGSEVVWYENPSWQEHTIATGTGFICMDPHDVDGDGDTDLAIVSDFSLSDTSGGGEVYWAEAPDDPTSGDEWELHYVDAVPTAHRLRWADIDGDGTKELLNLPIMGRGSSSPEYQGAVELKVYRQPADPTGEWSIEVLDDTRLEVAHAMTVVDWDGDAAADVLTAANAGIHLFRAAVGEAPMLLGAGHDGPRPDRGSSEVGLGHLGGQRFLATIEPWHGTDAVVYTPGATDAEPWTRRVLGTEFQNGHALIVADLNADGYDEFVAGGQEGDRALLIYRFVPSGEQWEKIELDVGGVAVAGLDVADIDDDGDLDVVAIGGSTNNIVWYESIP